MKRSLLIIAVVFIAGSSLAQQRGILSNFLLNDYYYNPAIAGSKKVQIANMSYRNQWVGFEGAPALMMANYHGSVKGKGKIGLGGAIISERTGITQNTGVYVNYAHHFKLSEKVILGLGIQPGFMQYRVRLYDAQLADAGDDVLTGSVYSANAFDVSTGFNLRSDRFFFMGSLHHLLGDQIQFTSYNENLEFHYNVIGGYNIRFKKSEFELQPSVMVKYTEPVPMQLTGMLKGTFNNKYWIGLLCRADNINGASTAGVSIGARIKDRISVGYGYDYTLSNLAQYQAGSHEVMLSIVITKEKPTLEEEDEELNKSILDEMQQKVDEEDKKKK